jgi:RNA polymerase sigma-70 factor, ECF subfamily
MTAGEDPRVDWQTTSTILQRLHDHRDRSMWQRVDDRFRRPIIAFARRLGLSESDADDAAQETIVAFIEAYQAGNYQRQRGRLSSWLFGIAHQVVANRRRRAARDAARLGAGAAEPADVADPRMVADVWEQEWQTAMLDTCLAQLQSEIAGKTYEAFRMVVREGISPDDAAAALGMTRDAVYVAKHRALKRLADLIREAEEA